MKTGCILGNTVDDANLYNEVDMPEGWNTIQSDLNKIKNLAHVNLMRCNKASCKFLQLGWDNLYEYSLGVEDRERNPQEK